VAAPTAAGASTATQASVCAYASTSVAVVVDFGNSVSAKCVPADSSDSGADALAASHQVRFNNSGFVCAIDGYPATGCGDQNGSTYAYWSYWHGTGGAWQYSNIGPAGTRVKSTVVEGWRFQPKGAGNPSDPAPRGSPDPAATCVPPPPANAPATPTTAAAAATPAAKGSTPTTPTTPSATGAAASTDAATDAAVASDTTTSSTATDQTAAAGGVAAGDVRVSDRPATSGGGSAAPVAVAGGAIALLGVGGVLIARRRSGPSP
jgi:hypothetical protein